MSLPMLKQEESRLQIISMLAIGVAVVAFFVLLVHALPDTATVPVLAASAIVAGHAGRVAEDYGRRIRRIESKR